MKMKERAGENRKGLFFWFLTCAMGSLVVALIERYLLNRTQVFYIGFYEALLIWIVLLFITLIVSSPMIYLVYSLARKGEEMGKAIVRGLSLGLIVSFVIVWFLSKSIIDTLYLVLPYFFFAFVFKFSYFRTREA